MSSKDQRNEYGRMRREIKNEYQPVCSNCGSIEEIQFHHVVPLEFGGRNVITNIVPLCAECHRLAHQMVGKKRAKNCGRPRKDAPMGYREALTYYITGRWTGKEVKKELGLDKGAKISEQWYYKEYLDRCGIERVKKKRGHNRTLYSTIIYKDGHEEGYVNGRLIC